MPSPSPAAAATSASGLSVSLLGGLALSAGGTRLPPPGRRKALQLLVWLLLEHPRPLVRADVARELFPDLEPPAALGQVRVQVHELRSWLQRSGGARDWVVAERDAVALAVDHRIAFDAAEFVALASDAGSRAGNAKGDGASAAERAEALYGGELWPGEYSAPIAEHRRRLESVWRGVLVRVANERMAVGDWTGAQRRAARLVELDPTDPEATRLSVEAHLGAGDSRAAEATLQAFREAVGPDEPLPPGLADLLGAGGKGALAVGAASGPGEVERRSGHVPGVRRSLVGRAHEILALSAALTAGDGPFVTLVGPGGTGKTRMAVEIMARSTEAFPDGCWFVDLASVSLGVQVLPAVARALGVVQVAGQPLGAGVTARLLHRTALVVVDNCEHVMDEAQAAIVLLRAGGPGVAVLATSRIPLDAQDERTWPLAPLSVPPDDGGVGDTPWSATSFDAPRLFCERAGLDFHALATDPALGRQVGTICRRLDGLPLAVELAASWTSFLDVAAIADQIASLTLDVADDRLTRPDRQHTLRLSIDWSYRLLSADEQRLFRRLGVFAAAFTATSARAVCSDSSAAEDRDGGSVPRLLDALVARSMVVAEDDGSGRGTFRLLFTIRTFALDSLAAGGEVATWRDRHAKRFAALATRMGHELQEVRRGRARRALSFAHADLAAAIDWSYREGNAARAWQMIGSLFLYWSWPSAIPDARPLLEPIISGDIPTIDDRTRGRAHLALGLALANQGDYEQGIAQLTRATEAFERAGDDRFRSLALAQLCRATASTSDRGSASAYGLAALRLSAAARDPRGTLDARMALAEVDLRAGRLDRAYRRFRRCVSSSRGLRDPRSLAAALYGLAAIAVRRAEPIRAESSLLRALSISRRLHEDVRLPAMLSLLGGIRAGRGDFEGAGRAYEDSLQRYRRQGHVAGITVVLHNLGDVAWCVGDLERARTTYLEALGMPRLSAQMRAWLPYRMAELTLVEGKLDEARDWIDRCRREATAAGLDDVLAEAWRLDARHHLLRGAFGEAIGAIHESLVRWRQSGGLEGALRAFDTWSEVEATTGRPFPAIAVLEATNRMRGELPCPRAAPEQDIVESWFRVARSALGAEASAEARRALDGVSLDDIWQTVEDGGRS